MTLPALLLLSATWPVEHPMAMEKNLPLIEIQVDGGEKILFMLDSAAAGCVIDTARAAALGLAVQADGMSSGSGGTQKVGVRGAVRLTLGRIEVRPPQCVTFDIRALKFKGPVEGILGLPLFREYVVELDYPGSRVRLFPPRVFQPPARAQAIPIRMTIGPVVRGTISAGGGDPIETDMQLDTGSAQMLTFCTPFVDRHKLLDAARDTAEGRTLGLGGATADITGRIDEVRVGAAAVKDPLVRFARQSVGSFATERHYSANLGGEFFKRYRVTIDVSGGRLFLE
ncbi:MAG: retropepsin-like aspartic protease [Bryobacteraceae bacterium]|nr:retropepsin-like aspartic protease [Bryobacteraceae bacterium]